jgi:hypothetical protein
VLKGSIGDASRVNRCVCYCADCRSFAHFLGRPGEILDAEGGIEVFQTIPANVVFTAGTEVLGCMRLSPNGLLRWYATCCNTPVGNTLANFRVSFVGLISNCLDTDAGVSREAAFGPIRMWANTKSTGGRVRSSGTASGVLRILTMLARARIDGSYRRTPFFSIDTGAPRAIPRVISREERAALMAASRLPAAPRSAASRSASPPSASPPSASPPD